MVSDLKKGNESSNPTSTKRKQLITNLAGLLTGIVCSWIKKEYPDLPIFEYQDTLTGVFVAVLGAANFYLTAASSKKVGLLG